MLIFIILLQVIGWVLCIWSMVFFLQIIFSLRAKNSTEIQLESGPKINESYCRYTVLVPAHNEQEVIEQTLTLLKRELTSEGEIIVIADNCTDNTAQIATDAGVTVYERSDVLLRGKGYALDFGMQKIPDQSDVVVIFDADCEFTPGSLLTLVKHAHDKQLPVQAYYGMTSLNLEGTRDFVALFAWRIKNFMRPMGMKFLNLPCQLMGSGMAFPVALIQQAALSSGSLVEDVELGLSLAEKSFCPIFLPQAQLFSNFPISDSAKSSQRARWEHGHLYAIFSLVPVKLFFSILRLDPKCFFMVLDYSVPPLSFLILANIGYGLVCVLSLSFIPVWLELSAISLTLIGVSLLLAWRREGRDILTFSELMAVVPYVLRKIPLYLALFKKRQKKWIKTDRK
jgi:glycosyltransferase involved in cell wall biosynthesis